MRQEVKDWLEQALADLDKAKVLFQAKRYDGVVVFAQQAAEKALKALYILHAEKIPPKIHDLVELCAKVKAPNKIILIAENLSGTYFFSRYPGAAPLIPVKFYTLDKAKKHLSEAEVILQWVQEKIQ